MYFFITDNQYLKLDQSVTRKSSIPLRRFSEPPVGLPRGTDAVFMYTFGTTVADKQGTLESRFTLWRYI